MYRHRWLDGTDIGLPPGKVVCVGRNYATHAKELGNPVPDEPLLFMKPVPACVAMESDITIPRNQGAVHHEAEIAVLIKNRLTRADCRVVEGALLGIGAALDLTLRELQGRLKSQSHPWEKAKAFDGSCPLSRFESVEAFDDLSDIDIGLSVNGAVRQTGNSSQMLFPVLPLIVTISHCFTLLPGDVVLTGTPAGVGVLDSGDVLSVRVGKRIQVITKVR